jgi:hypothetical protein
MAMKDKVSGLALHARMLAANLLVDSTDFGAVRAALAAAGVAEEAMPSDASFRSYQETAEYRMVYDTRAKAELQAFEAELAGPRAPATKRVLQSRLLDGMLEDLESGRLKLADRLAMWKALATQEHQAESRADRREIAAARLDLQSRKVAEDLRCKEKLTRTRTMTELAKAVGAAKSGPRQSDKVEDAQAILSAELAVVADEKPAVFEAISGYFEEFGGISRDAAETKNGAGRLPAALAARQAKVDAQRQATNAIRDRKRKRVDEYLTPQEIRDRDALAAIRDWRYSGITPLPEPEPPPAPRTPRWRVKEEPPLRANALLRNPRLSPPYPELVRDWNLQPQEATELLVFMVELGYESPTAEMAREERLYPEHQPSEAEWRSRCQTIGAWLEHYPVMEVLAAMSCVKVYREDPLPQSDYPARAAEWAEHFGPAPWPCIAAHLAYHDWLSVP